MKLETRSDLLDVLDWIRNYGSYFAFSDLEEMGENYIKAADEAEHVLEAHDKSKEPALATAHKIDNILRNFRIELLTGIIDSE